MECRICLQSDRQESMLRPCQCRGTSAYIHEHCLRTYLHYYPDRLCRVCHEPMEHPRMDIEQNVICSIIVIVWSCILLELSTMAFPYKLLCIATLAALVVHHALRKQLSYGIVAVCLLSSGLMAMTAPDVILQTVILVYALLGIAALCYFLSADMLFFVILIGLALTYSILLTLAVATRSDPAFTSLFLIAVTVFWLAFVRPVPPAT